MTTNNNDGRIPSVDEKPVKKQKPLKDRQQPTVGAYNKKKFNVALVAVVAFTLLVVGGVFYFVFSGKSKGGNNTDNGSSSTQQAVVKKSMDTATKDAERYRDNIQKRNDEEKAKRLAKEKEDAEKKALEDAKRKAEEDRAKAEKEKQSSKSTKENPSVTTPQTTPVTTPSTTTSNENELTPHQRRLSSQVMPVIDTPERASEGERNNSDNSLDSKGFAQGVASTQWRDKQNLLLVHGTNIPCALRTEIISTYSGLVTCNVISDIYSANGHTLLVEKGSSVFGTQNVTLSQGQARVFVKWSDITTPQGVSIKIDSLGTGQLGAAGVNAWVDTHFKERFGSAILLSFLDDAFATLANSTSKGNNAVSTENTQQGVSDMASKALENSINIPPTGYVPIGTRLNILVARDIDMSNVYRLVTTAK
ncbi:type IV secretion system protein VirB10 (plasmid) [Photobacterium leiognathi subsp. mandapamensis]|uniref:type IV secretion system protein VirB10 n=1 Tax=Photobacterium leiognathi TaxID=553611 RepID=UPI003AF3EFBA